MPSKLVEGIQVCILNYEGWNKNMCLTNHGYSQVIDQSQLFSPYDYFSQMLDLMWLQVIYQYQLIRFPSLTSMNSC